VDVFDHFVVAGEEARAFRLTGWGSRRVCDHPVKPAPYACGPLLALTFRHPSLTAEQVAVGSVVTRTYSPLTYTSNALCIKVFSADKGKPLSVNDESAAAECVATVKIPPFGITGRCIQVSFAFGEAELRVTQECEATGVHCGCLNPPAC